MQSRFDEELEYPGSSLGSRLGSFERLKMDNYGKGNNYKANPFGFENKSYVETLIHKNFKHLELTKSYELSDYFIISSLGILATFVYEIMALFRIFTLIHTDDIPTFGLLNNVRSFELFFSASAVLSIAFISLMYYGLYKFITAKWIKMCKFVSKLAGETFINHTKNCVLEKVSQDCRDQDKFRKFGKQFATALDYAIKEFEPDRTELSECSKYVWNKSKCSLCKLQMQCVVMPICAVTIAQSLIGAYVYYIAMYYRRVPLGHPTLITKFRWFAAVQYEGLLWISLQCTISLIAIFIVYKHNKKMPQIIEEQADTALGNANYFANILVNRIWDDKSSILNGNDTKIVGLESMGVCNLLGCGSICNGNSSDKGKNCETLSNSTCVYPTSNDYNLTSVNDLHEYIRQV